MKLSFHGGAQEVGRSCFTLDSEGFKLMLDCGIKIKDADGFPEIPDDIDAAVLSHAHLDHSGMLPFLCRKNKSKVYSTDISFEIAHLLQRDSVKISRKNHEVFPYTDYDIDAMPKYEMSVPYDMNAQITDDISLRLGDAGHIPGSSFVLINCEGKRILYTGDINAGDTLLQKGAKVPEADILITESTYGDRPHSDRDVAREEFISEVETTIDRGGNVIVPSFAVGRTQEVLMMLKDVSAPVYLDGMGQKMTSLFLQYSNYLRDSDLLQKSANKAIWVENGADRKNALREPSIIVTTAGMLSGGPVFYYLNRLHLDKSSSVLLTGYQVEGTNGRLLVENDYVVDPITEKNLPVKMEKHQFDFSAHSGRPELEQMIEKVNPEKAFVVHGDKESAESFAQYISGVCPTHVPSIGESFEL